MLLIVLGCIVPLVALGSALRMSIDWSGKSGPAPGIGHPRPRSAGRWEGLADEMRRRRGDRVRPRSSDAATRRRHLAAILPADARR